MKIDRITLRCTLFIFLGILLPLSAIAVNRPNIIVIVTDDQNKEDIACYRGKVLTPYLDRLAREGMRFDNAHVPSTVCTPSRYTLLTGRFPGSSYFELGNARAVRTRNWKYLAIRYDAEQFRRIQSADLLRLPRALAYIGNDKNFSNHLGRRSHFLESDQLYDLAADPMESRNLARSSEHAMQLEKLKAILAEELHSQARPFGEFVTGPDSVPVTKIEPFVARLARLKVIKRGFEVIESDTPEPSANSLNREERKKQRDERKKQRDQRNQLDLCF